MFLSFIYIMKLFSVDAKIFKKKKLIFFAHKKLKKHPKKLHTYGSWELFFLCSPACTKQPRTSFPFYNFFYLTISARISGFMQLKQIDLVNFSLLKRLQLGSNCGFYCWNSEKKLVIICWVSYNTAQADWPPIELHWIFEKSILWFP